MSEIANSAETASETLPLLNDSPRRGRRNSNVSISTNSITSADLLPGSSNHHNHSRPLLSPDDPQVSPLNLPQIKFIRLVTVVALIINAILFVCLLVSDFIEIPGFHSRGKAYVELNLIVIALVNNLITLFQFQIPSRVERTIGYATAGLLTFDFFVVFSLLYLKQQFGLNGETILLWTIIQIAGCALFDKYVDRGKRYQEIRYTGRVETRRTIYEMFVVSIRIIVRSFLLTIVVLLSFTLWLRAYDSRIRPWGEMVPIENDQFKVHLACYGDVTNTTSRSAQPIILIESGQLTSSEEFSIWVKELHNLNKIDRYCVWDRPGYGFSDSAPSPTSVSIVAEYLLQALDRQNIHGPFTLVGHDIGGLYSRIFASRFPAMIHSVLLVDAWHEDLMLKSPLDNSGGGNNGPDRGGRRDEKFPLLGKILSMGPLHGLRLWISGILSPLGLRLHAGWLLHRHGSADRLYGRDMKYQGKNVRFRLQEQLTSSILSYNELKAVDFKDLPLSVISSSYMIENSESWGEWQRKITHLSRNLIEWVIADESNHEIWRNKKGKKQLQDLLLRLIGVLDR
ncbi:hypothetical protein BABINDRAFT_163890 [Babjeviella inositovora NRRL Y-12698]|uniref:AB hydrolase-1 domain-containing protein n=1 Tax=Babjeviella inositovora NRRL Y-12698 TaxID=984486 RepID=A0A1E3QH14_9ASCO|nr:uncharacterized protein BABINDRAFT_163890 [Babjeviella inositovora NRRL Y-12698]ODQ76986.1 hypothetical protein BABINDRAFT_163890 [Babjeviella inositovora NRRL Y-12698]